MGRWLTRNPKPKKSASPGLSVMVTLFVTARSVRLSSKTLTRWGRVTMQARDAKAVNATTVAATFAFKSAGND